MEKNYAGGYLDYLYDLAGNVEGEWYIGPNAHYIYMDGQLVAEYIASTTYFVHKDHLGSTRLVTHVDQSLVDNMDYLPYGEQIAGGTSISHKFTGKERDSESNLDNFGARYDSSSLGRFMSPDPENAGADPTTPQSWNMYSYVVNNPLTFADPTGMECVWDNGSYDSENDRQTGSVSSCQNAGGTWIELGQNGNWSGQANSDLQNLASGIQNGSIGSVTVTTADGSQYTTDYNSSGQTSRTITPSGAIIYGYGTSSSTPANAGLPLVALGEGGCAVLEPCGAGEVAFGGLFLGTVLAIDTYRYFSKKPDIKTADDAWRKIQKICAAAGKQLDDDHREQWHEAIYGQGLGFGDLVNRGVEMFCPGAVAQ